MSKNIIRDKYKGTDDTTLTTYQLYEKYGGLPPFIAKRFTGVSQDLQEDLLQEGYIGLWKGCRYYVNDPKNATAINILSKYVNQKILNAYQKEYGRSGSLKRDIKNTIQSLTVSMTEDDIGNEETLMNLIPSNTTDWNFITMWIDVKISILEMKPQYQLVAYYILCGYMDYEIAYLLNISRSLVTKIRKRISNILK